MANRDTACQALDRAGFLSETVSNKAQMAFVLEAVLDDIIAGNTTGFLAAMLKGVKTEGCEGRSIWVTIDTEYTALMATGEAGLAKIIVIIKGAAVPKC